jgi:ATP-dependent 26S proteasome regulatory subunit
LAQPPGQPRFSLHASPDSDIESGNNHFVRLDWLAEKCKLSPLEIDVILLALAPEVDLRYQRLFAYLQDDVTRKQPSIDLALNLLCLSPVEKLACRNAFAPQAPLLREGLIDLYPESGHPGSPLLSHFLKLDPMIVSFLLGIDAVDPRLVAYAHSVEPRLSLDILPLADQVKRGLVNLAAETAASGEPLRLHFHGPPGTGKRQTAEAVAGALGRPLLEADLSRAGAEYESLPHLIGLVCRQAWLLGAVLYMHGLDAQAHDDRGQTGWIFETIAGSRADVILGSDRLPRPSIITAAGLITVPFTVSGFRERMECWVSALAQEERKLPDGTIEALAARYRLTSGQIEQAVASARLKSRWDAAAGSIPSASFATELPAAARAQSGRQLEALAQKIRPRYSFEDIVLPEDSLLQLREICQRVAFQPRVMDDWGFDRKLASGKGVAALFAGASGTGKTMAAEVMARELGLDLYRIDLAAVVSKYIGETEKNLDRIFAAAETSNAILFFDEADALFGKRSEVRDSHDRYANIEISYLLQKMEQYEGITILATNLRQNLDEAFVRRLAFHVHFPFPGEADRLHIWRGIWPAAAPLGTDVDLHFLARQFKLSGGNIKNVALSASFLAAADGGQVMMAHLYHATRREYQKMGKVLSTAELYGSQEEANA